MDSAGSYDGVSAVERLHTGTTDTTVNAADVALDIAHYSLDPDRGDASVNIDGDGSAVMDLYYKLDAFTVTFSVDGAETSADYFYGAVPAYDGEAPTLAGGDANTYSFLGWTTDADAEPGSNAPYYAADALPAVTGDATYYPYFGAEVNCYDITFIVDGAESTVSFPYGATPVYDGVPAKAETAQYFYTFTGWDPAIAAVTGEATYTAQFDETVKQYPVFVTGGVGSTIDIASGMRDYGTVLEFTVTVDEAYSASAPVVTVDGEPLETTEGVGGAYAYSVTVTGNTVISVSDLAKNTYTITFVTEDGSVEVSAAYGETPDAGFVPVKAQDAEYSYAFTGWNIAQDGSGDPLAPAVADETYYAVFEPTAIPAHEHDFATFVRTVAATCVSEGYDEYICECGMTEHRNPTEVDAANHARSAITVGAREATAEADGYTGDQICPACGATLVGGEVIPKDGDHVHAYDTFVRHVDATCVAKAFDEYVCSCGGTLIVESGEIDPDNHAVEPITVGAREATVSAYGYTGDVICPACDHTLAVGEVIEKLVEPHTHSFDTVIESHEATCIAKAYQIRKCDCGETQRVETGDVDPNNHVGEIRLLGHRDATAEAEGYTGDKYCLACGTCVEEGETIPVDTSGEPVVYEHGCPYCGKTHDGNILDRLLGLIHTFLHVVRTLFKTVPKS